MFKYKNELEARALDSTGEEGRLVYYKIVEAKDKGITAVDIKNKLAQHGFTTIIINKILKQLMEKGAIKKLKSL